MKRVLKSEVLNALNSTDALETALLFGVEIEFSHAGELQSSALDEDTIRGMVEENIDASELVAYVARQLPRHGRSLDTMRLIASWLYDQSDSHSEFFDNYHSTETYEGYVYDRVQRAIEEGDYDTEASFDSVSGWSNCEDGTSGIVQEYKTSAPMNYDDIQSAVCRLMDKAGEGAVVPLQGSCHIHVSFAGVRHTCSDKSELHACILYALSQHVDSFPACVKERLQSSFSRYFVFTADPTTKFTAVHCHSQGSWEFRLFGHMTDVDDINACIHIAGKAILEGYKLYADGMQIVDIAGLRYAFKQSMLDACPMTGDIEGKVYLNMPQGDNDMLSILAGALVHIDNREYPDDTYSDDISRTPEWGIVRSVPYGGRIRNSFSTHMHLPVCMVSRIMSEWIDCRWQGERRLLSHCNDSTIRYDRIYPTLYVYDSQHRNEFTLPYDAFTYNTEGGITLNMPTGYITPTEYNYLMDIMSLASSLDVYNRDVCYMPNDGYCRIG